jgi:levanase
LFVGWLNNWQYAQSPLVPTTRWWRGQHSEPRELALETIDGRPELVQQPLRELDQLHAGKPYQEPDRKITGERTVGAAGKQLDIRLRLHSGTASRVGVKVLTGSNGDETVVGYDAAARRVYIDRTRSGTAGDVLTGFAGVHSAPLRVHGDELDLRILVDHSIVEVFANHGERVLTDLVYPAMDSDGIALFAEGGTAVVQELVVKQMRSIWSPTGASVNAR